MCISTNSRRLPWGPGVLAMAIVPCVVNGHAWGESAAEPEQRSYENRMTPIDHPQPLLADHPEFVQPVIERRRFEAPVLIDEKGADMRVRAWRFSYNARGIIEVPNRIRADRTAVIMVHPWGIDDGHGWNTPQPAGVADFCTVEKNHLAARHTREIVNPLLQRLRDRVALVMYSMRAGEHPVHKKLYRSIRYRPSEAERAEGAKELREILSRFEYRGQPLPERLAISRGSEFRDYFRQFPGLDAGPRYNNEGFWDLPVPVCSEVDVHPEDIVYYDHDGYPALREYLKKRQIHHILLTGYATDMCFCSTTAGYKNLSQDFNVFLVGDATLATFPANQSPRYATNAHLSFASLDQFITQCSWIRLDPGAQRAARRAPSTRPDDRVAAAQNAELPEDTSILITADRLAHGLNQPGLRILDTRTHAEYSDAHIPGALRVDVNDWKALATTDRGLHDANAWSAKVGHLGVTRDSPVVVYGDRLSDTARIWWLLKYVGVQHVAILNGGWQCWVQENQPVQETITENAATSFEPEFQLDRLAEIAGLKQTFRAGTVQVVDARSADEFTGEEVRGERGGHIPGAAHLEWKELLAADGRFKTRDELRALFRERGILPDETAVCY